MNIDLRVFAQYVAPALGIRYRFVGEEPVDYVTKQYNIAMKKILPSISEICVIEIPRKCINGKIISATTIREYYSQKDFIELGKLVPKSTLDYLMRKTETAASYV